MKKEPREITDNEKDIIDWFNEVYNSNELPSVDILPLSTCKIKLSSGVVRTAFGEYVVRDGLRKFYTTLKDNLSYSCNSPGFDTSIRHAKAIFNFMNKEI